MRKYLILTILLLCSLGFSALAQTRVYGVVTDASTGEPLPYVSVVFPGTRIGTMTDLEGKFSIEAAGSYSNVSFQMLGYETYIFNIRAGATTRDAKIKMNPDTYGIQAVVVRPRRRRDNVYRRRGNPAVELVKNVIQHKEENHIKSAQGYKVDNYDKLVMSLDKFDVDFENHKFWSKFPFMEKYVDTAQFKNTPVLTVSLRENLSTTWFQKSPKRTRTYVLRRRSLGLDEPLDAGGLGTNIRTIFADSDIFEDNMEVLLNRFVSPLSSSLATTYYKYYISDTLMVDGVECIDLTFVPFNSESFSFTGHLYVVKDSTYAVKKYTLGIPAHINLNFVSNLAIEESFEKMENGKWASTEKNTYAQFYIFKKMRELYAHKKIVHTNYDFTQTSVPDSLLRQADETIANRDWWRPDEWWTPRRPVPLTRTESLLDSIMTDIYAVPKLRRIASFAESMGAEYFPTVPLKTQKSPNDRKKSLVDIGPVFNTMNYNMQEGFRLRLGFMTTATLHNKNFFNGYVAYGFRDQKFKGELSYIHTFEKKDFHPFEPLRHYITFTASYDLEGPGQSYTLLDRDNILMTTFKEQPLQYVRRFQVKYDREWLSRLSFTSTLRFDRITPTGTLSYTRYDANGGLEPVPVFNDYSWTARIRYAPGEPLFSSRLGKEAPISLAKDAPIVSLTHTVGYFDNQFWYNKTEFSAQKRIWLSSFGHIDAALSTGFIWNRVPLPKLFAPNANPSFLLVADAFNLMRPMEFVMDQYADLFVTYYLKGWIFNRIPLLNKLKLREVVSFRAIIGSLSEKNNPLFNTPGLYALPEGTGLLNTTPYMEYTVGIENIFKFLRVDYVRRISYTEGLTEAQKNGFKISIRITI
ncbi:MAG: carboxypeptidase-like regulatory domain-containing protein [Bacteroidales bacterium]|nr:carboxypeptidase-like regulatory domain-containing protein [Bacteroidales bacterium]